MPKAAKIGLVLLAGFIAGATLAQGSLAVAMLFTVMGAGFGWLVLKDWK